MKEEYVNGEITRKLIDKGCPVTEVFISDGRPILYELPKSDPNWFKCKAWYIPTISQVLKWLREEKNIHIEIRIFNIGYGFDIYNINPKNKLAWSGTIEYKTYEEAAIAGIEYILNNLI